MTEREGLTSCMTSLRGTLRGNSENSRTRIRQSNPFAVGKGFSALPLNANTPTQIFWVGVLAEKEGFEPSVSITPRPISNRVP